MKREIARSLFYFNPQCHLITLNPQDIVTRDRMKIIYELRHTNAQNRLSI